MSMILSGAENQTMTSLEKLLCYEQLDLSSILNLNKQILREHSRIKIKNKIFIPDKHSLNINKNKWFQHKIEKFFAGSLQFVNFEDAQNSNKIINKWIAKNSNNKMTNTVKVEDLNANLSMFLVNFVFLKCVEKKYK